MEKKDLTIKFLLGVTFGNQYENICKAKREDEIIQACLYLAWNDAFRHVTRNTEKFNNMKDGDKVKAKDGAIIELAKLFPHYVEEKNKGQWIQDNKKGLKSILEDIKVFNKETSLTLGHYQKLFNMAVKLYACAWVYREELGIKSVIKEYNYSFADCPLDRIILKSLNIKENWSQIPNQDKYQEIQNQIGEVLKNESKDKTGFGRLAYDFLYWQKENEE